MSAKLSSTLAGMAFLDLPFLFLLLGPLLDKRFCPWFAFENATAALDKRRSDRLQENTFWRCLNNGFRPVLNVELLAQPRRDDDLPFRSEPNRVSFHSHLIKSDWCLYFRQIGRASGR